MRTFLDCFYSYQELSHVASDSFTHCTSYRAVATDVLSLSSTPFIAEHVLDEGRQSPVSSWLVRWCWLSNPPDHQSPHQFRCLLAPNTCSPAPVRSFHPDTLFLPSMKRSWLNNLYSDKFQDPADKKLSNRHKST